MANHTRVNGLEKLVAKGLDDPNNLFFQDVLGYLRQQNWLTQKQYYKAMQYHNEGDFYSATCTLVLGLTERIDQESMEKEHYRKEAYSDSLTGLPNRRHADEERKHLRGDYAFIKIDIDHFKDINDRYSHEFGDIVLQGLAQLLTEKTREDDIVVSRLGGEEFLVLIKEDHAYNAYYVAQRLRAGIESELGVAAFGTALGRGIKGCKKLKTCKITACFGIAYSYEGDSPDAVMNLADNRLYEAKNSGRNRVCDCPASAKRATNFK